MCIGGGGTNCVRPPPLLRPPSTLGFLVRGPQNITAAAVVKGPSPEDNNYNEQVPQILSFQRGY